MSTFASGEMFSILARRKGIMKVIGCVSPPFEANYTVDILTGIYQNMKVFCENVNKYYKANPPAPFFDCAGGFALYVV